jgi:co-chaperonin GroES (HSP10)
MYIEPTRDNIICVDADFGDQTTAGGIIIKSNIKLSQGISSRWMQVFAVGPEIDSISAGDWVLVEYGRWTEEFSISDDRLPEGKALAWKVDPKGCMAVSSEKPETLYYNSAVVTADRLTR